MPSLILKSGLALGALLGSTVPAAAAQANPPAVQAPLTSPAASKARKIAPKVPAKDLVDMNKATSSELMKLPEVTADLAAQVIARRPYYSKEMLISKGALPVAVWQKIRGLIVAAAPFPSKAKPQARPKAVAQP